MIQHSLNRKEKLIDVAMDLLEYLAVLVTPHPKETMQVIERRRKDLETARIKAGIVQKSKEEGSGKIFKKEHRNTTFYDEIRKHAGDAAAETLIFEDSGEKGEAPASVESYDPDFEDMAFIEKAKAMQAELEAKQRTEAEVKAMLNTVDF